MLSKLGSDFGLRLLSSVLLAPLALAAVWYGGAAYIILILLVSWRAAYEWLRLSIPAKAHVLTAVGIVYCLIFMESALWLREVPDRGLILTLFVLIAVWGTDVGAYLAGRLIGGPKLAPSISPKKTWAGLIGGMTLAVLLGELCGYLFDFGTVLLIGVISAMLGLISQIGDLLESALKRHFNVKDSGNLIPGHGGILDRIDGLMLALPALALLVATMGHTLDIW